jgi:uncharacterized protein (TIGR00369 family)
MIETAQKFNLQPNSKHCFVCGMESPVGLKLRFTDNGADEVRVKHCVPEIYQGYPGVVHGGIVAAMLDETGGRVVMINAETRFFYTAKMELRYRQPVPTETELTLIGRLVKDRGRIVLAHAEIQLPDGKIAAEADLMLAELPEQPDDNHLAELGWKIYPEETKDECSRK